MAQPQEALLRVLVYRLSPGTPFVRVQFGQWWADMPLEAFESARVDCLVQGDVVYTAVDVPEVKPVPGSIGEYLASLRDVEVAPDVEHLKKVQESMSFREEVEELIFGEVAPDVVARSDT